MTVHDLKLDWFENAWIIMKTNYFTCKERHDTVLIFDFFSLINFGTIHDLALFLPTNIKKKRYTLLKKKIILH